MASAQMQITNTAQNPLCNRLQQKFSGRGAAAISASQQTRAIPKAVSGGSGKIARTVNPFEETTEFVPAGKTADPRMKNRATKAVPANDAAVAKKTHTANNRQQNTQVFTKATPFASGAYASAYARAASIRAQAAALESKKNTTPVHNATKEKSGLLHTLRGGREDEVRVKSSSVPKSIVIAIVLFTAIIMMILFSFSQINEFKREISGLESQRNELNTEISQLAIQLDLKNDVRVIEQTAREDIGMVRRNQVESKYINIAQGDRVEVMDDTEENQENFGIFTTLLSSFGSSWNKLMEYID